MQDYNSAKPSNIILVVRIPGSRPPDWKDPTVVYKKLTDEQLLWKWLKQRFQSQVTRILRSAIDNKYEFDVQEAASQSGIDEKDIRTTLCSIYKKLYNRTIVNTVNTVNTQQKIPADIETDKKRFQEPNFLKNQNSENYSDSSISPRLSVLDNNDLHSVESVYNYDDPGLNYNQHSSLAQSFQLYSDSSTPQKQDSSQAHNEATNYQLNQNQLDKEPNYSNSGDSNCNPPKLGDSYKLSEIPTDSTVKDNLRQLEADVLLGINRLRNTHGFKHEANSQYAQLANKSALDSKSLGFIKHSSLVERQSEPSAFQAREPPFDGYKKGTLDSSDKGNLAKIDNSSKSIGESSTDSRLQLSELHTNVVTRDASPIQHHDSRWENSKKIISTNNNSEPKLKDSPSSQFHLGPNSQSSSQAQLQDLNFHEYSLNDNSINQVKHPLARASTENRIHSKLSESSSFSEFSDESVTRSALRDALMSQMDSNAASSIFPSRIFMWRNA